MPTVPGYVKSGRANRAWSALAVLGLGVASGCQSAGYNALSRWRLANDHIIAPPPSAAEVGDTRMPLMQKLMPWASPKVEDPNVRRTVLEASDIGMPQKTDPETMAEFQSAEKLFQDGKLEEAEQAFAKLSKRKNFSAITSSSGGGTGFQSNFRGMMNKAKPTDILNAFRRNRSVIGEKTLFYLAESQYRQGKLTDANDSYGKLAENYPGSQFLPKVAEREYAIALMWLDAVDPNAPAEKKEKPGDRLNGRLPLVDVNGHALLVLEHVRHHDVKGPFADDAVMRIAEFHMSKGNYEEAALYYDQLISDDPKSPFLLQAHIKTIDARLKAYAGPEYDPSGLEDARKLIQKTMVTFPDRDPATSEFLTKSLELINEEMAAVTYQHGEFYRQTGYPGAAELSFAEVRARWPKSRYASLAREQLALISKAPRKEVLPSKIMTTPGAADPYSNGNTAGSMSSMGMMGMGGMGGGMGGPSGP